jgi:hypothetical protein
MLLGQYHGGMVTCWASGMGGCSKKQSAEHYVTRGLWTSSEIMISGFDWQKGQSKMLPVATVESKILCERHNNLLSGIDAEATKIFGFLGDALLDLQHRQQNRVIKKSLLPKRLEADGKLFERWCTKTLVDFVCVEKSDAVWHKVGTPLLDVPLDVLNLAHGLSAFQFPAGLYLAQESTVQPKDVLREALRVDPRFHPQDNGLMGAFLEFRDFRFLIWLSAEPFEGFVTEASSGAIFGSSHNEVHYHPDALKLAFNHVVTHEVVFSW